MKRVLHRNGLVLLAIAATFTGCDPGKNNNASPTTPGNASPSPSGSSNKSALEAFNKPRKTSGDVTLKLITNGNSPFWDSLGEGLKVGVKESGDTPNSGWTYPNKTDNASQKDTFEQAIAANVDGIGVSTIQADAFAPVINAAIEKGIPVITFDSDAPTSKRLAYIGTNNYDAGKKAGEAALALFPNGGSLVAFVGNMTADNARQRYQGFLDAVKGHNITMLQEPYEDDKDAVGRAHANVADAITKYGAKINGFLGLYSYNGPAIVDEVMKANLLGKVKIIVFDGEPRTLDNLGKGRVDLAIIQKPYEFGRLSAKLLTLINRKGLDAAFKELKPELEKNGMTIDMDKGVIDTGVDVITPAKAPAFLKELKDKGLKST